MTSQTATAKPYSVKKMEPQTVLREVRLSSGVVVSYRTPGYVTWAVVIAEAVVFAHGKPEIFDRKGVAELEADYLNREAEREDAKEPQS